MANPTLDLAGGTTTLTSESANRYYKITDSVGGGTLILNAGAVIIFDDAAGAGFDSTIKTMTITINGTAALICEIKSQTHDPTLKPIHPWLMPNASNTVTATYCTFSGYYQTFTVPTGWTLTNCILTATVTTSIPYSFSVYFPHEVELENIMTFNLTGVPIYSAKSSVNCYMKRKSGSIMTQDGKSESSDIQLTMDGDVFINPMDRVTLPDGSTRFVKGIIGAELPNGVTTMKLVLI